MDYQVDSFVTDETGDPFHKNVKEILASYDAHKNILMYLIEMGLYVAAEKLMLEANFDEETINGIKSLPVYQSLPQRSSIVNTILANDPDSTIQMINKEYPTFFASNRVLLAKLYSMKAATIIKVEGREASLAYCRSQECINVWNDPECMDELRRLTCLIISPDIHNSRHSYLLTHSRKLLVARDISRSIIKLNQPEYKFNEISDSIKFYKYSSRFSKFRQPPTPPQPIPLISEDAIITIAPISSEPNQN